MESKMVWMLSLGCIAPFVAVLSVESFLSSELQNLLSGMGKLTEMARGVNGKHKCTAPDPDLGLAQLGTSFSRHP